MSACISFMVAGHTKFAPDWCFGLLKSKMRRAVLSSQADIEAACKASAVCNLVQCVGMQDGQVIVPCYDWATFFRDSGSLQSVCMSFHNFAVSAAAPSVMEVRKFSRGAAERLSLGKVRARLASHLLYLPRECQWSDNAITEFCREGTEGELLCPETTTDACTFHRADSTW